MKAGGQREGLGAVGTQGVAGEPGPAGQDQGGQLLKHPTPLPLPRGLSCDSLGPYLTGHCCELSLGPYLTGHCRELNLGPYLTGHCSELSYIPQIDVSEPQHPRIWLYVKTRLLKRWLSYNEVLRVGPDPDDWGPYGKRLGRRHTQSDVRRQREDGCLHAKERGLRRNQPCRHRDLRPLE